MGITPWYVGDTAPAWTIPLTLDNGVFSVSSLTPSNFVLLIHNNDTNVENNGTGTFQSLVAASGTTPASIVYVPSSTDTATLGNYTLFIVVTYPNSSVQTLLLGAWQVIPK